MSSSVIREVNSRGVNRYKAIYRKKVIGQKEFSRSKTFDEKTHASAWLTNIANEIELPNQEIISSGCIYNNFEMNLVTSDSSIWEIIDTFLRMDLSDPRAYSDTYRNTLKHMRDYNFSLYSPKELDWWKVVHYCNERFVTASATTLWTDFHALAACIVDMEKKFNVDLCSENLKKLKKQLIEKGYVARPKERIIRPSQKDLQRILDYFAEYQARNKVNINYVALVKMHIFTCLRTSELLSICWKDLDNTNKIIRIRKNKNTKRDAVIEERDIPFTQEMKDVLAGMETSNCSEDHFIFNLKSFSTLFSKTIESLEMTKYRLHDLRVEGISRYIEQGLTIDQIVAFTGHRDKNVIWKVYVKLNPSRIAKIWDKKTPPKLLD